jgi:carbon-monoxide dehydrogenase large subunit
MPKLVGTPVPRREDHRLVTGTGCYLDDHRLPGMLHATVVRSRLPHARLDAVKQEAARALPGVVGIWTAADLPAFPSLPARAPVPLRAPHRPVLAQGVVRHVGEPIALVVATDRFVAADAADLVEVDYDPMAPVLDAEAALAPDAVVLHPDLGTNETYRFDHEVGDPAAALAQAPVRVQARTVHPRLAAVAIEPRGVLAEPGPGGAAITVWTSTQAPFGVRDLLAPFLGLSPEAVRVIAPDVGGAFGVKNGLYPEEVLVAWASLQLGRPIKWTEGRSESMVATTQGRGLVLAGELAASREGRLLALRASIVGDAGAYLHFNTAMPPIRAFQLLSGCYQIPAMTVTVRLAFTNKVPTGPYRGAGRPEGIYLIEKLMDELAHELDLDPAELRRRNFIAPEAFPYQTATGMEYDSGNYAAALERALAMADYPEARKQPSHDGPHLRGVGISCFVETAGVGPGMPESARVAVDPDESVTVHTGTSPHGQGHETTVAQLVADELGVGLERIRVLHGDTAQGPRGTGTFGSRSAPIGGTAVLLAARAVRARAADAAAHLLEARSEDVVFGDGRVTVAGTTRGITLGAVAAAIEEESAEPLAATHVFSPTGLVYPFGAHVALVDIDRATGQVHLLRYIAVDDCGRVINPLIVDGQIHGGVAQGVAEALYEEMVFDATGQPQTATLMDYGIPSALDVPAIETDRTETPSPLNALGAKGVGESGTIGAPIAIANAVRAALRPLGIGPLDPPFSSEKVWRALHGQGSKVT